jgi:hypothetical protein
MNDSTRSRGRVDHRLVAEQLARERGDDFREDAERRQDQDVDLGVAPDPDQVHVHHGVAAAIVREEVHVEVAVQAQQRQRTVSTGKAATISTLVHRTVQVNTGMRISVMPGARIFRMVTRKLTPVSVSQP